MDPAAFLVRFRRLRRQLDTVGGEVDNMRQMSRSGAPLTRARVSAWHEWCRETVPELDELRLEMVELGGQLMEDDVDEELRVEFAEAIDSLEKMRRSLDAGREVLEAALKTGLLPD